MSQPDTLYATCAPGLERLLESELRALGADRVQLAGSGVRFAGGLPAAYRACLWSRVANRVLLPIHDGVADSPEALYSLARDVDWSQHMPLSGTLAVDFLTAQSNITHTQYGALKVKDAVVDQFRELSGERPSVDRDSPSIRINVYVYRDKARIAIDLSGTGLHRRGYRQQGGLAPIKENLAAALLLQADWPERAARGEHFVDPMCGSGTLVIEAAMIACRQAPGLTRSYFGFLGWRGHDPALWESVQIEARGQLVSVPMDIVGCDRDASAIRAARENAAAAGVADHISLHQQALSAAPPPRFAGRSAGAADVPGLLVSNPPYGERLDVDTGFHQNMGRELARHYAGWDCGLFTASQAAIGQSRLPLDASLTLKNGGIDCTWYTGRIPAMRQAASASSIGSGPEIDIAGFSNRLRKNLKSLKGWRKSSGVRACRIYDADLPEFAVAIDVYDCEARNVVVQEYQAPASINPAMAEARFEAVQNALPSLLDIEPAQMFVKLRRRQSGTAQYERQGEVSKLGVLEEHGVRHELNFSDYLDTGLFLDHRKVRHWLRGRGGRWRFLNLFAYTGTATVAAIAGGADRTTSVDLSKRYCEWTQRNLRLNDAVLADHEIVRSDVMPWLLANAPDHASDRYDVILLDPPTFSNSSDLDSDWSVQRDHVACIRACMQHLATDGVLIFSNNFRRFKLDSAALESGESPVSIEDRSRWSIDKDFQRNPRIHQCWFVRHEKGAMSG